MSAQRCQRAIAKTIINHLLTEFATQGEEQVIAYRLTPLAGQHSADAVAGKHAYPAPRCGLPDHWRLGRD